MSATAAASLDEIARRCIHCGLCLSECPTYLELGSEPDSPRGRIQLMRHLADGALQPTPAVRTHLDRCLDCRACEAVCPSDVRYGELIEHARGALLCAPTDERTGLERRVVDWVVHDILPHPRRCAALLAAARAARRIGLTAWLRRSAWLSARFPALRQALDLLPDGEAPRTATAAAPFATPPTARAMLFRGCATSVLTPRTAANVRRLLEHHGCAVDVPERQVCCGAIHHHSGRRFEAQQFARANLAALAGEHPIVTFAAGCGAMLRQYPTLLVDDPREAARAAALAARVVDVSQMLLPLRPATPPAAVRLRLTYHDACHHAHAQRLRTPPRELLARIPGLELLPCPESDVCCGAAGSYNLLQPEIAGGLARRKLSNLNESGAALVAAGNVGCILHLRAAARRAGSGLRIAHFADVLAFAFGLDEDPDWS